MRLVRFMTSRQRISWGWLDGDPARVVEPVGKPAGQSFEHLLGMGGDAILEAVDACDHLVHDLDSLRLLPPIARPSKIIAVGRNYREHAAESGSEVPKAPMLFGILPSALTGPFDEIHMPRQSQQVDWEGELGVVIGRVARNVHRDEALAQIAGYTVINDISARDLQRSDGQWTRAKSFDTFKPCGPCLTTFDELGLAEDLHISVKVNGIQKQSASTKLMVFPVADLIEYISAFCTLLPGDIIATGTPSGVGFGQNPVHFLMPGDTLETEIEGIGKMINRTVSPSTQEEPRLEDANAA